MDASQSGARWRKAPHSGISVSLTRASLTAQTSIPMSQSMGIAARLSETHEVVAYDPKARPEAEAEVGDALRYAGSAASAIEAAEAIVLATPWSEFASPDLWALARGKLLIDCWGLVDSAGLPAETDYVRLGSQGG